MPEKASKNVAKDVDCRDFNALLDLIITKEPYSSWKKVSSNPDRYRDYSEDENPKYQLSRFGLYDFSAGKNIKSSSS